MNSRIVELLDKQLPGNVGKNGSEEGELVNRCQVVSGEARVNWGGKARFEARIAATRT